MTTKKSNDLHEWIDAFLRDVKTRGLSDLTHLYYKRELAFFAEFCAGQKVAEVEQVTPDTMRDYIDWLEHTRNRTPGGRHAGYRAVRAFLTWWGDEAEPDDWTNPTHKAKAPKVTQPIIEGISAGHVKALLETCEDNFTGIRDRAIILFLLDSGVRARELLALTLADVDTIGGAVTVRKGKGNKSRMVYIGKKCRKALRAYLKHRTDDCQNLWVSIHGDKFAVSSLTQTLIRRAQRAGIPTQSPHDFRRSFALNMLRAGVDIYSLKELMGHSDLSTLMRYLALINDDMRAAHDKGSPVDRLL